MDLMLNLGGSEAQQDITVAPAARTSPTGNGQRHDRSVELALGAGAARMADEQELRREKGKQPIDEEGSLVKWPVMPTRHGSLLPLFPAPLETGDVYPEENTQGVLRIGQRMPLPVVEEREAPENSFWSYSTVQRLQEEAHRPTRRLDDQDRAGGEGSSRGETRASRKKTMLPKEGTAILEASFKENPNVCPKQKDQLAKLLKIKSRQVEVWFQNKRARLKLKQAQFERERLQQRVKALEQENQMLESLLAQQSLHVPTHPFIYTYQPATNDISINSSYDKFAPRRAMRFATSSGGIAGRSSFAPSPAPPSGWFSNPPSNSLAVHSVFHGQAASRHRHSHLLTNPMYLQEGRARTQLRKA